MTNHRFNSALAKALADIAWWSRNRQINDSVRDVIDAMAEPTAPKPQQPAPATAEKPRQFPKPLPMYSPSAREAAARHGYEPFAYTERN